jgi:hypothetical protein
MACDLQQLHEDYFAIDPITGQIVPTNTAAPAPIAMDDLTDADTTTVAPVTGDLLKWDGTNWVPETVALATPACTSDLVDIYWGADGLLKERGEIVEYASNASCVALATNVNIAGFVSPWYVSPIVAITNTSCKTMNVLQDFDWTFSITQNGVAVDFQLEITTNGGTTWAPFHAESRFTAGASQRSFQNSRSRISQLAPGSTISCAIRRRFLTTTTGTSGTVTGTCGGVRVIGFTTN